MRKTIVAVALIPLLTSGCIWFKRAAYEGFGRDDWQQPDKVVAALGVGTRYRVADLGSGGGYFTFRLAEAVRPDGVVYAVDVDREMNDWVAREARDRGLDNVQAVLAAPDDPHIPVIGVHVLFTCNTYHHLQDRVAYFSRARKYLRPGGRVAIIDFKPGWTSLHATSAEEIRSEMEAAGYVFEKQYDFLERQNFLVFTAPKAPQALGPDEGGSEGAAPQ